MSNITTSFVQLGKMWRMNDLYAYILSKQWEIKKKKKLESGHYTFRNCYAECSTEEAIILVLSWATKNFRKNSLLQIHFGWIVANQNKKTRIRDLYVLILLYTRCSRKKQYYYFFHGARKISKRKIFTALWVNSGKSK